ncbi:MAG: HD domain-containing protein [Endomicrobiales bacterium]|nr:HD domain-containing protein [Endomicrobiales bacterium]
MSDTITLDEIKKNPFIVSYLKTADSNFAAIGYKEHGMRHAQFTATVAGNVLKHLDYPEREVELARIAGYLHDIGNSIAQNDHAQNGAVLTLDILEKMKMPYREIFQIIEAIGSHEDKNADAPSAIAAAVILGDKTDVHHTRVRSVDLSTMDMHGRVNYACERAFLRVDKNARTIALELTIDNKTCPVMDYFEIFMQRLKFCRQASKTLKCEFVLFINKDKFL